MKYRGYVIMLTLLIAVAGAGCRGDGEGWPSDLGGTPGGGATPGGGGGTPGGGGGTPGGVAFSVTAMKLVQPSGEELAIDEVQTRVSRAANIKITYTGARAIEPALTLDGQAVELQVVSEADGVLIVKPMLPLHNLKKYNFALGDSAAAFKVKAPGDINGDGQGDFIVGAPGYQESQGSPAAIVYGAAFVYFGKQALLDAQTARLFDIYDFLIWGNNVASEFGSALAMGDINGDGYDDVIAAGPAAGPVSVFYGPLASNGKKGVPQADAQITKTSPAAFGYAVAAGDVNGDGFDDIIIGEPLTAINVGAVYVVFGKKGGIAASVAFSDAAHQPADTITLGYTPTGTEVKYLGRSVATADLDGDGKDDIIIGAPHSAGATIGKVFVVMGADAIAGGANALNATTEVHLIKASAGIDRFGISVSARGGAGGDEVLIGAASKAFGYALADQSPVALGSMCVPPTFSGETIVAGLHTSVGIGDPSASKFYRYRETIGCADDVGQSPTSRLGAAIAPLGDLNGLANARIDEDYLVGEKDFVIMGHYPGRVWINMNIKMAILGLKDFHFGAAVAGGRIR